VIFLAIVVAGRQQTVLHVPQDISGVTANVFQQLVGKLMKIQLIYKVRSSKDVSMQLWVPYKELVVS